MSRPRMDRPGKVALWMSVAVHTSAILLTWLTQVIEPTRLEYAVYEIQIVSLPSSVEGEPEDELPAPDELIVETPDEPEPVVEEAPPPPERSREEAPPPLEEAATPTEDPEPEPDQPRTSPTPDPDPEGEETGEDIMVRMEGLRRDFPVYYENIIRQIRRCFRWRGTGDWVTSVHFYIDRNGAVSDLRFIERSGNPDFDFTAMGAVECAGRGDRFGDLPADLQMDRFPIIFEFNPAGGETEGVDDPGPAPGES